MVRTVRRLFVGLAITSVSFFALTRESEGQINTVTLVFSGRPVRSANFDADNIRFRLEISADDSAP